MENNERKNNNRGMFYAVMGVATLVITLIGATFAYFVATTNSAANVIATNSTSVSLQFADVKTGLKGQLIPVDTLDGASTTLAAFANGGYKGAGTSVLWKYAGIEATSCRDANQNNICSVYQFTVTNPTGNPAQYVYARLNVRTNTFTNLKYALFKGTSTDVETKKASKAINGWDVNGTEVTAVATTPAAGSDGSFNKTTTAADATRKHVVGVPGDLIIEATTPITDGWDAQQKQWVGDEKWNRVGQILDAGETMTYTMIIWLEETHTAQNEQNKAFAADLTFTTEGDSTGVTGSLIIS